jgi:glucosamine--fructose-6-phosphate aminotransferase (isomerizing)
MTTQLPSDSEQERGLGSGLRKDMLAVPGLVRNFDVGVVDDFGALAAGCGRLQLCGEGSNLFVPPKVARLLARQRGYDFRFAADSATQARGYDLDGWAVLGLSNSGRTAETVRLFRGLSQAAHPALGVLTAEPTSTLAGLVEHAFTLAAGPEHAVAATKTVLEEALFVLALCERIAGDLPRTAGPSLAPRLPRLADALDEVLHGPTAPIRDDFLAALAPRPERTPTIFWAGLNDGVAEELTLKTFETVRRHADHLEGTYALHGVEEVMRPGDVVLWIDPVREESERAREVLVDGAGVTVLALADRDTPFPTLRLPDVGDHRGLVALAAGWRLLHDLALASGIDPDKPLRARKVGNELRD